METKKLEHEIKQLDFDDEKNLYTKCITLYERVDMEGARNVLKFLTQETYTVPHKIEAGDWTKISRKNEIRDAAVERALKKALLDKEYLGRRINREDSDKFDDITCYFFEHSRGTYIEKNNFIFGTRK